MIFAPTQPSQIGGGGEGGGGVVVGRIYKFDYIRCLRPLKISVPIMIQSWHIND